MQKTEKKIPEKEKVNSVRLRGAHQFERRMGKEKVGEEARQRWWQDESPTGAMMLAHMMSKMSKNAKQRKAIIDSLNATQMRDVGHLMRGVPNVCRKLPKKQINQLIRDRKFIDAIVRGERCTEYTKGNLIGPERRFSWNSLPSRLCGWVSLVILDP